MPKPLRVLIIEDSATDTDLILHELRRIGFLPEFERVDTAASLRQALAGSGWDIALCDCGLPHLDATEVLRLLKQLSPDLPCIVVSGTLGEESAVGLIREGAADFVRKDSLSRLPVAVEHALNEANVRREHQRAEALRRESDEKYRLLVERSPDAIYIHQNGHFAFINPATLKLFGASVPEQLLGRRVLDFVHPDFKDVVLQRMEASRQNKPSPVMEQKVVRLDGSVADVEAIGIPFVLAGELASQVILRDITARKRTEKELRQREEQFRALIEGAKDFSLLLLDSAGCVSSWNTSAERIHGYTADEILGRHFSIFYSVEEIQKGKPDNLLQVAAAQGRAETESWQVRKDGSHFWANSVMTPLRDEQGELRGFVKVTRDISERKQAEETLRASEEVFRLLFSNNPLPMWVYETGTLKFLEVNDAAIQHYGFSRDEFLGLTICDVRPPEDVPQVLDYIRKECPGLRPPCEWRHRKKNGEVINVYTLSHSLNFAGHPAVLVVIQDVTERKKLEEQFRQSQKMEAVGQLAGGVAHDFNNILTVISGHTHLLLMDGNLDGQTKESLNQISASATRAANLTRQLLAFSRKQMMQPKPLNLNSAIENLTQMLRRIIGEDISLQYTAGAALPFIEGDSGMIEQVLMNLVVNARDAMPRGGKLFIETQTISLDVAAIGNRVNARAGKFVCLSVRDTGSGIAPEILSHIFEPFFTTKEVGKGSGLGLATVYGIVNQHKGWIEVESKVGAGTIFKIFFGAISTPAAESETKSEHVEILGGKETILLVEDENGVRQLARRILEQQGYNIVEAESGRIALNMWHDCAAKVDLLLTDLVMPDGVSGKELAEQLRREKPRLKIIYTSGYSTDTFETDYFRREKRNFLQKPYDANSLRKAVRECLDA